MVNGIERENDTGDARDAALVDGGNVVPEVVVVDAVDLPVHLVGAGSVQGAIAAPDVARVAGSQLNHLGEVAAVEREVCDNLCIEHRCLRGGGGIE